MKLDLRRVATFIRSASTETLLDRVTIFRCGMEPAAVDLMIHELSRRGIDEATIASYHQEKKHIVLFHDDGEAVRCSFCDRPAILRQKRWHRLWKRIPIFPKMFAVCDLHQHGKLPQVQPSDEEE